MELQAKILAVAALGTKQPTSHKSSTIPHVISLCDNHLGTSCFDFELNETTLQLTTEPDISAAWRQSIMASVPPSESQLEIPIFGPDSGILASSAGARRLELNRAGSYGS